MSSRKPRPDARARIVRAAAKLLATGGRNAVTTRAVSAAAGVQPPTIYRHFGDMQELLGVVARETLTVHVREQATRALTNDPVEDLRRGWDLHVAFGLANADAGRLRVDVLHATVLVHAAGTGVTLTLAATPPEERDPRLSDTMREAIITAVTVPATAEPPDGGSDAAPAAERVAVHAVALRALLAEAPSVLSPAERQLLSDWLERLATAGNLRTPMRRPPPAPRRRPSLPAIKPRPS